MAKPIAITVILILQFVPLLLFPPDAFAPNSQEWWLPALLAIMVLIATLAVIVGHTSATWPWKLMVFAQGFNIISRLMLLWPHAAVGPSGETSVNTPYIALTLLSIVLSTWLLIYLDRPEVRTGLLRG